MKNLMAVFAGMMLIIHCSVAFGLNEIKQPPRTVKEAVSSLLQTLPADQKDYLLQMPQERRGDLHFGLGLYIRNYLIRTSRCQQIMKSCAKEAKVPEIHIDTCSSIIINAFLKKLHSQADPLFVKSLDEQLDLLRDTKIKNRNWDGKNLEEIICDINLQLTDLFGSTAAGNETSTRLLITTASSVDLTVRRDFPGGNAIPLLKLFEFLEERYHLRMKRRPPQIILYQAS